MPESNFYLKQPKNTKEPQLIYLFFSFNGKRLKYSTQEKVLPKDWNSISQKVRSNDSINDILKKIAKDAESIERNLRISGVNVTPQLIRDKLDVLYDKKKEKVYTLFSFIDEYIEKVKTIKKPSTIKGYRNTFTHLKNYKSFIGHNLDFNEIDLNFHKDFTNYLINKKKFSQNTIGKQFKNIKVFMTEASESGFNSNQAYKHRKFKVQTEEVDSIYLNEKELEHIFKLDLSEKPKLERVRDLFIIGCYTGLRFSDFSSIKPENIKGNFISIKTIKMNKPVVVPIHKYVRAIINKYKNQYNNYLPPALSNQKMNDYLKEIGKLANLSEKIQKSHMMGVKRINEVFLKHELLTTHTARRSFATNLYLANFPSISIMHITGHKTERAFMKYIKVTPEQHAKKLQDFWQNKQ